MNISHKILLSIPSIIGLLFMLVFIFPTKFGWLLPNMKSYYIWVISINITVITAAVVLIKRIWTLKKIEKSTKWIWTFNMMFFHALAILIYVWKIDSQIVIKNKRLSQSKMR